MSYSPGGGSGSVNGSSDVATSNLQSGQLLTWSTSSGKWVNQLPNYALGTAENPQTNYAATRNAAIPINWWACAQTPTNWVSGDIRINLS